MRCVRCGAEMREGDSFCQKCGTPVEGQKSVSSSADFNGTTYGYGAAGNASDPGYQNNGSGYSAGPVYENNGGGYGTGPGYQNNGGYSAGPGYQNNGGYGPGPGYQNNGGYGAGPGYQNNGGYSAGPGYQNNGGYGPGPGYQNNAPDPGQRSLPAFIVGLLGSIMGMLGGICTSMCDLKTGGNASFILIFGGAVVGLIGACMCLNKAKTGSVLELIGAVMMIICAYGITGADIMSIFGFVLLLTGGIIGAVQAYFVKPK